MNIPLKIEIRGTIEINDASAEVLQHLLSYEHLEYFNSSCSRRWTADQMSEATKQMRIDINKVIKARSVAVKAINAEYQKEIENQ